VGAAGAFFFALWRGRLSWRVILDCAIETARTTGSLFAILIGALLFSQFMNFAGLPNALKDAVTAFGVEPLLVIFMILLLYIVLGTFFEELSMILLTVPIFHPLVVHLGFDPIWFGVVIVMVVELGMISPPVGMNLFVVQSMLKTPITTLWRWIAPFVAADIVRLAIVVLVPQIVLFLPRLMK
jgi:TRAP-type C4-dicarboxylate transport system permease large subunit